MPKIPYRFCPLLAGIDAILSVFILYLLGGFENGAAWATVSAVASVGMIALCGWMAWLSVKELKESNASDAFMKIPEDSKPEPLPSSVEKTTEETAQKSEEIIAEEKKSVPIQTVSGFARLAANGSSEFEMADVTEWLKGCREIGAYPLALPCDGRVFADANASGFSNTWLIGDVHGDLQALNAAFAFADKWSLDNSAEPPVVISLGDLFDRGDKSLETVICFLGQAKRRNGRVGWISGNHDCGFCFDAERGIFASSTFPNQFTMWLNAHLDDAEIVAFGQEVAALCGRLPAAAMIPGGVLLVHGGVPHTDIQPRIHALSDLEDADMRHDFVWGRFHDSLKRKRPSREANCQIGVLDVFDFLKVLEGTTGIACKAILRGHDHFAERVRIYEAYSPCAVVTFNTCSTLQDGAYSAKPLDFTPPAVVHCNNGALEVFLLGK